MEEFSKEMNEIALVENDTIELKTSLAERKEILETVSAFSNTRGGTIYIGIGPDGEVAGVDIGNRTTEHLANEIKQNTDPKVFPIIEIWETRDKKVIVVKITEYPTKPVWAKDKVFLRVGRSNQRASAEKIRQFIYKSRVFKWDHQVVPNLKLQDIESARVKRFLEKVEEERNTTFDAMRTTGKILEKLSLLKDNRLTNASLLLFAKHPQVHFPQSEVRCARFIGTEPVDFADIQAFDGSIIEQVPAVLNFIRRHINVAAQITGEPERKEVWEYPREALREAVVNAICHRNYEDTGNVQVRVFDDRLEVWNPGSLPENMTIEMLRRDHRSRPRNELIARCFYLIKYIEQWGTGTNRMIKWCREAGLPGLDFFEISDSFIVIFRRKMQKTKASDDSLKAGFSETQEKIIEYLKINGQVSTSELVKYLKLSRRTVQRNIKQLNGIVEWTGESPSDPKGRYILKEED
jgi:ATP-dependent DNA helicase RecG